MPHVGCIQCEESEVKLLQVGREQWEECEIATEGRKDNVRSVGSLDIERASTLTKSSRVRERLEICLKPKWEGPPPRSQVEVSAPDDPSTRVSRDGRLEIRSISTGFRACSVPKASNLSSRRYVTISNSLRTLVSARILISDGDGGVESRL